MPNGEQPTLVVKELPTGTQESVGVEGRVGVRDVSGGITTWEKRPEGWVQLGPEGVHIPVEISPELAESLRRASEGSPEQRFKAAQRVGLIPSDSVYDPSGESLGEARYLTSRQALEVQRGQEAEREYKEVEGRLERYKTSEGTYDLGRAQEEGVSFRDLKTLFGEDITSKLQKGYFVSPEEIKFYKEQFEQLASEESFPYYSREFEEYLGGTKPVQGTALDVVLSPKEQAYYDQKVALEELEPYKELSGETRGLWGQGIFKPAEVGYDLGSALRAGIPSSTLLAAGFSGEDVGKAQESLSRRPLPGEGRAFLSVRTEKPSILSRAMGWLYVPSFRRQKEEEEKVRIGAEGLMERTPGLTLPKALEASFGARRELGPWGGAPTRLSESPLSMVPVVGTGIWAGERVFWGSSVPTGQLLPRLGLDVAAFAVPAALGRAFSTTSRAGTPVVERLKVGYGKLGKLGLPEGRGTGVLSVALEPKIGGGFRPVPKLEGPLMQGRSWTVREGPAGLEGMGAGKPISGLKVYGESGPVERPIYGWTGPESSRVWGVVGKKSAAGFTEIFGPSREVTFRWDPIMGNLRIPRGLTGPRATGGWGGGLEWGPPGPGVSVPPWASPVSGVGVVQPVRGFSVPGVAPVSVVSPTTPIPGAYTKAFTGMLGSATLEAPITRGATSPFTLPVEVPSILAPAPRRTIVAPVVPLTTYPSPIPPFSPLYPPGEKYRGRLKVVPTLYPEPGPGPLRSPSPLLFESPFGLTEGRVGTLVKPTERPYVEPVVEAAPFKAPFKLPLLVPPIPLIITPTPFPTPTPPLPPLPPPPPPPLPFDIPGFGSPTMLPGGGLGRGIARALRGGRWMMPGLIAVFQEPLSGKKVVKTIARPRARKYGAAEFSAGGIRL